jgi:hypothetical protein
MIDIEVSVTGEASGVLRALIAQLTGPERAELNAVGGRAAAQEARRWSKDFDDAGRWRTSKLFPSSGPSRFGGDVAQGWAFLVADHTGALIHNDADHYAFRVRGGTITPKRVQYLTLPLVPEAKGLRAEVYVQNTGRKLFTIPGRNALFERTDAGNGESTFRRTTGRNRDGSTFRIRRKSGIRPVYALVKSVTLPPRPDAVPPDDVVAGAFTKAWRNKLADRIERLTA